MPGIAIALPAGLFGTTVYPYSITIGGIEVGPTLGELGSIEWQDNADDEPGRLSLRYWDSDNSRAIRERAIVHAYEQATDDDVFLGTVQRAWYDRAAVGRYVAIEAIGVSSLLDEILVPFETRPAGESDRARVLYLWGKYGRSPLSGDPISVTQTQASMPADAFINLTLRSALRQCAAQAGSTVKFAIDALGKLHWFAGTETNPAPFNINVAQTPGGGNIAPTALRVEKDGVIKNRAYVRGANEAGSGYFQDDLSVSQYGTYETYLDAPSADTAAKAQNIARLYFGRVAQPRLRGSFSTESPNTGWRAGQYVTITDPQNGLSASSQRIARVTTTFISGTGKRRYVCEFGSVGARGSDVADRLGSSIGIPGQLTQGTITDDQGNPMLSTILNAATAIGSAVRRFIQAGVWNGDFALAPVAPDSTITGTNELPYWTFTEVSGTAIKFTSSADVSNGSGRVIKIDMAAGSAGDDAYLQQLVPVPTSRGQSYYFEAIATLQGGTLTGTAYVQVQYLRADGSITGGSMENAALATTRDIPQKTVPAGPTLNPPTDAAFMRIRIGLRRGGAAVGATEQTQLVEVRVVFGPSEVLLPDLIVPSAAPVAATNSSGTFLIDGRLGLTPVSDTIAAAGDQINPGRKSLVFIAAGSPFTLTSTPTVPDGTTGALLVLLNVGGSAITVQDQGTLAGSNLRLATATYAIDTRDSLFLIFDGADWIELGRAAAL